MIMNKLAYSVLFAFCLGYIVSDFNFHSNLFPVAPARADVINISDDEVLDVAALLEDLEFRLAVKEIVEDCIVEDNKILC